MFVGGLIVALVAGFALGKVLGTGRRARPAGDDRGTGGLEPTPGTGGAHEHAPARPAPAPRSAAWR